MSEVLILRPEPGASRTAVRAAELGLGAVVAPIFEVRPMDWRSPNPNQFDAVLVTSANAVRFGGLDLFLHLPCYTVGTGSAEAAKAAGFEDVRTGPSDGKNLLDLARADGVRRLFHPAGRDVADIDTAGLHIERRTVYASEPLSPLPSQALATLREGALALIHSPRAGAHFGSLADAAQIERNSIALAAISEAAAEAAGEGWKANHVASTPRDEALLELAAELCHK